jgi:hypothetical protein
VRRRKLH